MDKSLPLIENVTTSTKCIFNDIDLLGEILLTLDGSRFLFIEPNRS
jgi:hypothetical protein